MNKRNAAPRAAPQRHAGSHDSRSGENAFWGNCSVLPNYYRTAVIVPRWGRGVIIAWIIISRTAIVDRRWGRRRRVVVSLPWSVIPPVAKAKPDATAATVLAAMPVAFNRHFFVKKPHLRLICCRIRGVTANKNHCRQGKSQNPFHGFPFHFRFVYKNWGTIFSVYCFNTLVKKCAPLLQ